LGKYAGTPCTIPYGEGSIYGFFSQDNVQVGDVIIKDQVSVLTSVCFQSDYAVLVLLIFVTSHIPGVCGDYKRGIFGTFSTSI